MLHKVHENKLTVIPEESQELIQVFWEGKSVDREPEGYLTPFLNQVLSRAEETGARVEMDFTRLTYMNSSTITPVLQMLDTALVKGQGLTLKYDSTQQWQEVSFSAMKFFETVNSDVKILGA